MNWWVYNIVGQCSRNQLCFIFYNADSIIEEVVLLSETFTSLLTSISSVVNEDGENKKKCGTFLIIKPKKYRLAEDRLV